MSTQTSPGTSPPAEAMGGQARDILRQMLQVFKSEAHSSSRLQLHNHLQQLLQLAPQETKWQEIVRLAQKAIANPKHSYLTLAPVIIKSLKQATDLIEIGQPDKLQLNPELQQLANSPLPQILLTLEPKAAASTLMKLFNKQQLSQIVTILQTAS